MQTKTLQTSVVSTELFVRFSLKFNACSSVYRSKHSICGIIREILTLICYKWNRHVEGIFYCHMWIEYESGPVICWLFLIELFDQSTFAFNRLVATALDFLKTLQTTAVLTNIAFAQIWNLLHSTFYIFQIYIYF